MRRALFILLLAGCEQPPEQGDCRPSQGPFVAPEGLAVAGELLVVANTHVQLGGPEISFDPGSISVVERGGLAVVNEIPTSAKNPQVVISRENDVIVLCTGRTAYDSDTGVSTALEAGAIDLFAASTLDVAAEPTRSIAIGLSADDATIGGPGSLVIVGDTAYAGSSLSAVVFAVDPASGEVVRGPDNPIRLREHEGNDTVSLGVSPDGSLLATSFNTDSLFRIDPGSGNVSGEPLDVGTTSDLEGALDVTVSGQFAYVLLTLSSRIARVDLDSWSVDRKFASTGVSPNKLAACGEFLYVVNSGSNNIGRVGHSGGNAEKPLASFCPGSDPWALAVAPDCSDAYASLMLKNAVVEIDLQTSGITGEADGDE